MLQVPLPDIALCAPPAFISTRIIADRAQKDHLDRWYGSGWRLLYRASRDGWHASDFHRECDGEGATVTIVRTTDGHVFGGHLTESWHSRREWIHDTGASLFTLSNPHGVPPTRFPIADPSCAACGDDRYGPVFGGKIEGNDLHIASRSNAPFDYHSSRPDGPVCPPHSFFPNTYTDPEGRGRMTLFAGSTDFVVDEIEVFGR